MNFDNVLPGLVVIIYIFVEIAKKTFLKSDKSRNTIPLISAILGVVLAVAIFYLAPEIIFCSNVLEAVAMGGMSGFAATGCNQLYKKYTTYKGENTDNSDSGEGY